MILKPKRIELSNMNLYPCEKVLSMKRVHGTRQTFLVPYRDLPFQSNVKERFVLVHGKAVRGARYGSDTETTHIVRA